LLGFAALMHVLLLLRLVVVVVIRDLHVEEEGLVGEALLSHHLVIKELGILELVNAVLREGHPLRIRMLLAVLAELAELAEVQILLLQRELIGLLLLDVQSVGARDLAQAINARDEGYRGDAHHLLCDLLFLGRLGLFLGRLRLFLGRLRLFLGRLRLFLGQLLPVRDRLCGGDWVVFWPCWTLLLTAQDATFSW